MRECTLHSASASASARCDGASASARFAVRAFGPWTNEIKTTGNYPRDFENALSEKSPLIPRNFQKWRSRPGISRDILVGVFWRILRISREDIFVNRE